MTRRRHLLLLSVAILSMTVVLAVSQKTRIAEGLIVYMASSVGVKDMTIRVSSISFETIEISGLSFNYEVGDSLATVSVTGLTAHYDLRALGSGRVHTMEASSANIQLTPGTASAGPSIWAGVLGLMGFLEVDLVGALPTDTLAVDDLQIRVTGRAGSARGSLILQRLTESLNVVARLRSLPAPVTLEASTGAVGTWEILALEDTSPQPIAELTVSRTGDQLNMVGSLDLDALPTRIAGRADGIINISGTMNPDTELPGEIALDFSASSDRAQVGDYTAETVGGGFRGKVTMEAGTSTLVLEGSTSIEAGRLSNLLVTVNQANLSAPVRYLWNGFPRTEFLAGSTFEAGSISRHENAAIDGLRANFSAIATGGPDNRVTLRNDSVVAMDEYRLADITGSGRPSFSLGKDLSMSLGDEVLRLMAPTIIHSPTIHADFNGYPIVSGPVTMRLEEFQVGAEAPAASGGIATESIRLGGSDYGPAFENLEQEFSFDGSVYSASGTLTEALRGLPLYSDLQHNLANSSGELELRAPDIVLTVDTPLATLIQPLPLPLQVITGNIDALLTAEWISTDDEYEVQARLMLTAEGLGGAYENMYFSGLSTALDIELLPEIRTLESQHLWVDTIDIGLPVTDTMVDYQLFSSTHGNLPAVEMVLVEASVLDGKISMRNNLFDPNIDENHLQVNVAGISLAEVVALHQLEDIVATGIIDGSIPISLSPGGASTSSGKLFARAPGGRIAYTADTTTLASAAPGTEIVFSALKNFNYTSLEAEPDYDSTGRLVLGLKIQGRNPDLEGGRPINLNVNLEQNVLDLLQSLRFVDGLNEAIDSRVLQFYRQSARTAEGRPG